MKLIRYLSIFILFAIGFIWFGTKDALIPMQREQISKPIFTLGDHSYQAAVSGEKRVLKFGPMFWGLYPGGLAFKTREEAVSYMLKHQSQLETVSKGWAVYQLSGDFDMDTYLSGEQMYINTSLVVLPPDSTR